MKHLLTFILFYYCDLYPFLIIIVYNYKIVGIFFFNFHVSFLHASLWPSWYRSKFFVSICTFHLYLEFSIIIVISSIYKKKKKQVLKSKEIYIQIINHLSHSFYRLFCLKSLASWIKSSLLDIAYYICRSRGSNLIHFTSLCLKCVSSIY